MKRRPLLTLSFALACGLASFHCRPAAGVAEAEANGTQERARAGLPADYETLSACAKEETLWKRIETTAYARGAAPELARVDALGLAWSTLVRHLATKMDRASDEAPAGYGKPIHKRASVARVKFVGDPGAVAAGVATGLLVDAPCGLLRASLTSDPGKDAYNPGFAWKAFVDGKPSRNLSALVSLDGQGADFNFFRNAYSHVVPPSKKLSARAAKAMFETVSKHAHKIGVTEFAAVTATGAPVSAPRAPRQLVFVPDAVVRARFAALPPRDFRDDLASLPVGATLFHVYGVDGLVADDQWPRVLRVGDGEPVPAAWKHLGALTLTSGFVASAWGDDGLFFRHERFDGE